MKIVVTGAGSGGHITPVLAVAHELKSIEPDIRVIYLGHEGDSLADIPSSDKNIDQTYFVKAGKLRRYNGEGLKQLLDFPTLYKNLIDMVYVVIGIWQSFWLLRKIKPDAIFIKGGYVGIPVGLCAALLRIPYMTHDSDAMPGLANRVISPWAKIHSVALPKEVYDYPEDKTETVGVPMSPNFYSVNKSDIEKFKKELGLSEFRQFLFITGGGLGARRINDAVVECMPHILARYKDLVVVHTTGREEEIKVKKKYENLLSKAEQGRVVVKGFVSNLYKYSGAADVIITRAGATAIAEFATQGKACIVIPNPLLAGGHQLKNAKVLANKKAVKLVDEDNLKADPLVLMAPLSELLDNQLNAIQLGEKLHRLSIPDASKRIAMLLLEISKK